MKTYKELTTQEEILNFWINAARNNGIITNIIKSELKEGDTFSFKDNCTKAIDEPFRAAKLLNSDEDSYTIQDRKAAYFVLKSQIIILNKN